MASRSLNKVQLIGNLTRDPELRYTPQGTAVCVFGLATNRYWTTESGEKREETEFHRIVAWNKLAELCAQLLFKGRKVYVEGRLQTRAWTAQDGSQRQATEVVIEEMIILDSRQAVEGAVKPAEVTEAVPAAEEVAPAVGITPAVEEPPISEPTEPAKPPKKAKTVGKKSEEEVKPATDDITEDIPF